MCEVNLMLGGSFPKDIDENLLWCGVDRGASFLIEKGVTPLYSFGDFDSIDDTKRSIIEEKSKKIFIKESQNETDSEFALDMLINLINVKTINIYGATGKRLDHFFGNIYLLKNKKYHNIKINIIDDNNIITLAKAGENIFYKKEGYKYFSIVPLEEATYMSISGAKYNVENFLLTLDRPNATSNEFIDEKICLNITKDTLILYTKD